jgi:hypothetical protein
MMITRTKNFVIKPLSVVLALAIINFSFSSVKPTITLKAGTGIMMETVKSVSSELLTVGSMIDFRVTEDIKVDGVVVVEAGASATGQVVRVAPAKGLGKAGYIAVEMRSVKAVDGTNVRISGGDIYNEGENQETLALVLGLLVCILFLTMKGKNAYIQKGYSVIPAVAVSAEIEA